MYINNILPLSWSLYNGQPRASEKINVATSEKREKKQQQQQQQRPNLKLPSSPSDNNRTTPFQLKWRPFFAAYVIFALFSFSIRSSHPLISRRIFYKQTNISNVNSCMPNMCKSMLLIQRVHASNGMFVREVKKKKHRRISLILMINHSLSHVVIRMVVMMTALIIGFYLSHTKKTSKFCVVATHLAACIQRLCQWNKWSFWNEMDFHCEFSEISIELKRKRRNCAVPVICSVVRSTFVFRLMWNHILRDKHWASPSGGMMQPNWQHKYNRMVVVSLRLSFTVSPFVCVCVRQKCQCRVIDSNSKTNECTCVRAIPMFTPKSTHFIFSHTHAWTIQQ